MDLERYLAQRQRRIEQALRQTLRSSAAGSLGKAMRYGLLGGGKRLRPILTLAASECVGGDADRALPLACAIEMIHAYSLIHDDLPAMDDDDLRRGRPTTHVVFGEALAILAGDALLADAFGVVASAAATEGVPAKTTIALLREIAAASGSLGIVAGQARDMEAEFSRVSRQALETTHRLKTGALLRCAVRCGAIVGGGRPKQVEALTRYGEAIGLAFQIVDDLLDAGGSTAVTGKRVGRDAARHKATFPDLLGIAGSRRHAHALVDESLNSLAEFDERADALRALARHIVARIPATQDATTPTPSQ